jgi:hypothetical protein
MVTKSLREIGISSGFISDGFGYRCTEAGWIPDLALGQSRNRDILASVLPYRTSFASVETSKHTLGELLV